MDALQRTSEWILPNEVFERDKAPLLRRTLSLRGLMPFVGMTTPVNLVPSRFIGLFSSSLDWRGMVRRVVARSVQDVVHETLRVERLSLREEKKRPWSLKTRKPLRGIIDRVEPTFRERMGIALDAATELSKEIGPPWETSERGRPQTFDPVKLVAALMVKGRLSFSKLSSELRNIRFDATLNGSGMCPSPSHLHHVFDSKVDRSWLQKAVEKLDTMVCLLYGPLGGNMDTFVIDGSSATCDNLEERDISFRMLLLREYESYTALTRIWTNTVRGVVEATNKVSPFLDMIPNGSTLLADPEFDVDVNYWEAMNKGIRLHVKQKNTSARKPGRKMGRRLFDQTEYRRRKLGERYFGNIEVRGIGCPYRKEHNRLKGLLLTACEHNTIAWFKGRAWCGQFILS